MFKATECLRKAHDLPDEWQPYRLESLGSNRTHVRIDGAVFPHMVTRGPRKGRTNFKKPEPGTERIIVVSNAEYDEWMAEVREARSQASSRAPEPNE